jgi:hypothetical protein
LHDRKEFLDHLRGTAARGGILDGELRREVT